MWGGERSHVVGWEKGIPGKGEVQMLEARACLARPSRKQRRGRSSWSGTTEVENENRGQRARGVLGTTTERV